MGKRHYYRGALEAYERELSAARWAGVSLQFDRREQWWEMLKDLENAEDRIAALEAENKRLREALDRPETRKRARQFIGLRNRR